MLTIELQSRNGKILSQTILAHEMLSWSLASDNQFPSLKLLFSAYDKDTQGHVMRYHICEKIESQICFQTNF